MPRASVHSIVIADREMYKRIRLCKGHTDDCERRNPSDPQTQAKSSVGPTQSEQSNQTHATNG